MMNSKDIESTRRIEDWSNEQIKLHRRECKDSGCCGRSKLWWITRHPKTHPDVANKTAVDFVLSRQCCEILELRLVKRRPARPGEPALTWLAGELELNRSRTIEEKAQLLGRDFLPLVTSESTSVEVTGFTDSERKFLEVSPESPYSEQDSVESLKRRLAVLKKSGKYVEPKTAQQEPVDWVDALTRRRD